MVENPMGFIEPFRKNGVDIMVAGSSIFGVSDRKAAIERLVSEKNSG